MNIDDLHTEEMTLEEAATVFKAFGCGWRERMLCQKEMVNGEAAWQSYVLQGMSDDPDKWTDILNVT